MPGWRPLAAALFLLCAASCQRKPEAFTLTFYPGSTRLDALSTLRQQVRAVRQGSSSSLLDLSDTADPPERVVAFYAKDAGIKDVAPDVINEFRAFPPAAYLCRGDLGAQVAEDARSLKGVHVDIDPAMVSGTYRCGEVLPTLTRPAIHIQRPYFDPFRRQVVDRTLITMEKP